MKLKHCCLLVQRYEECSFAANIFSERAKNYSKIEEKGRYFRSLSDTARCRHCLPNC